MGFDEEIYADSLFQRKLKRISTNNNPTKEGDVLHIYDLAYSDNEGLLQRPTTIVYNETQNIVFWNQKYLKLAISSTTGCSVIDTWAFILCSAILDLGILLCVSMIILVPIVGILFSPTTGILDTAKTILSHIAEFYYMYPLLGIFVVLRLYIANFAAHNLLSSAFLVVVLLTVFELLSNYSLPNVLIVLIIGVIAFGFFCYKFISSITNSFFFKKKQRLKQELLKELGLTPSKSYEYAPIDTPNDLLLAIIHSLSSTFSIPFIRDFPTRW